MGAVVRTENTTYVANEFVSEGANTARIRRDTFSAPIAASATNILNAHSADGSTQNGAANPDPNYARTLQYVASTTATGNVTANGKDLRGNAISETVALNNTTAVHGTKAFFGPVTITLPSGAYNVSVGTDTGLGLDRMMPENDVLIEAVDGTQEAVGSATVGSSATAISGNYIKPVTAPNGTHNYVVIFATNESYPTS